MEVIIDKNAGPCPGVKKALKSVEKLLNGPDKVISLGPVIHNSRELERLNKQGLIIADQDDVIDNGLPEEYIGKTVFIRAHGISPTLQATLEQAQIGVFDGTCGKVKHVQKLVEKYHEMKYQIVITGKKGHPEVQGILGYCDDQGIVITDTDFSGIDPDKKTLLVSQTTFDRAKFMEISKALMLFVKSIEVTDTTCKAIRKKHKEITDFAGSVDVLLMVGGKQSSNTGVLFEQCKQVNAKSYRIESENDVDMAWFNADDTIGITGSASTPVWQLEQIAKRLNSL